MSTCKAVLDCETSAQDAKETYVELQASEGQGAAPANSGSNIVYAIPLEDNIDNTAAACGSTGAASAHDGKVATTTNSAVAAVATAKCF